MVIPVGTKYTAVRGAAVERRFRCEHCGFEARAVARGQAHGTGISPFFIDAAGAKTDANVKALFAAREQARFTLDIVPCPRCNRRSVRAEKKFQGITTLVSVGSIVLGVGLTGVVGFAMRAPMFGLLVGVFATGLGILVDTMTRKATWKGAAKRVTFEEPGSGHAESQHVSDEAEGERGKDVSAEAKISLADAMTGGKLEMVVHGKVPCSSCSGTGTWAGARCKACSAGAVELQRRVLVKFPAGIDSGHRLRVVGLGMPGLGNARPGDLYVDVEVASERRFERHGDDLETHVRILPATATLGGKVDIDLPDGSTVSAPIAPATKFGTRLKVAGKGMPRLGRPGHGDLHVVVEVGN